MEGKDANIKSPKKQHKTIYSKMLLYHYEYFHIFRMLIKKNCFEVNWIPEIWSQPLIICISIRKYILPTFENVRAGCRTKAQENIFKVLVEIINLLLHTYISISMHTYMIVLLLENRAQNLWSLFPAC